MPGQPVARSFARHKQSTGLFVPGLSADGRAGATQRRRAGGAQAQDAMTRLNYALVMSSLEFMRGLAALVPRPRQHLIRYQGGLAHNAKLRASLVPQEPELQERTAEDAVAGKCDVRPHRQGLPLITDILVRMDFRDQL